MLTCLLGGQTEDELRPLGCQESSTKPWARTVCMGPCIDPFLSVFWLWSCVWAIEPEETEWQQASLLYITIHKPHPPPPTDTQGIHSISFKDYGMYVKQSSGSSPTFLLQDHFWVLLKLLVHSVKRLFPTNVLFCFWMLWWCNVPTHINLKSCQMSAQITLHLLFYSWYVEGRDVVNIERDAGVMV